MQPSLPVAVSPSPIAIVGNLNLDYRTSPIPAGPAMMLDGETTVGEISEHWAVAARTPPSRRHDWAAACTFAHAWAMKRWVPARGQPGVDGNRRPAQSKAAAHGAIDRPHLGHPSAALSQVACQVLLSFRKQMLIYLRCGTRDAGISIAPMSGLPVHAGGREPTAVGVRPVAGHGDFVRYQLGSHVVGR